MRESEIQIGNSGLSVAILDTASEIEQMRDLWSSWPGSRDSDIDFFLDTARVKTEVVRPYVLMAKRGGVSEAILIGRLEQGKLPVRFGYLNFNTPRLRILDFVYGALRGNATLENIELLVGHVLKSLRHREIDMAVFEQLQVDSHLYHAVRTLPGRIERGFPPEHRTHRCLQLPETSEALYKSLPPKHRHIYRGKARKIVKVFAGDVHIKCYRSISELDQMFRDVEEIAAKTYQRGLGFGFRDTPEMRSHCELAASKGWLRVFILYLAGRPSAYWIAMAYGGTLWGDHIGFDPAYSHYSPGIYLSLSVIGELCDQKRNHDITQINFGVGDAEYKSVLSSLSFEEGTVQIYGHTLRGLGTHVFSTPVVFADRVAKKILSKSNSLTKLKRMWRDHAENAASHRLKTT